MKAFAKTSAQSTAIELIEMPLPKISNQEMLVKVQAIGVGIHDEYFLPVHVDYPYVVGIEAAGVIEKTESRVTKYKIGQRIAFISAMQPKGGTWAEYAAVAESSLILPMPAQISFEQGSALMVAGNTALKALAIADLKPSDTLFIAGGSGAIGTLLVQIAKSRGYKVATSASTKNHDYMKSLGADKTVDYHDSDWQQQIKDWLPEGVDGAIAIHPGTANESQSVVKDSGVIVAVSGDQFKPERNIRLQQVNSAGDVTADLAKLLDQVATDEIKLTIEKVYPFADGLLALEKVKTRHARGKLVLLAPQDQIVIKSF